MDYIKLDAFLEKEKLKRATFNEGSIESISVSVFEEVLKGLKSKWIHEDVNICIYWIDRNDKVNANVVRIDDTYYVGLFSGVISALRDHFDTYYRNLQEDFDWFVLPTKDVYIDFRFEESDSNKSKICNYLMSCAISYLVMHEFGHILCGHCREKEVFFYENESESNKLMGYKSQAKEMWADFYGIANSYNLFLCTLIKNPVDVGPFSLLYLLAAYSVFWIFNFDKKDLSKCDCSKMTHPHPQVRFLYFIDLVEDELQHSIEMFKKRKEIYAQDNAVKKIYEAVLEDFMYVLSRTDMAFMYDEATFQKCDVEVKRIKEELRTVVEFYKEKAYVLPKMD